LRIIAGKYRGRRLKSPPSSNTRPTSDRLRETLFNIIAPRIEGARFLDLCAGSGAVGIEALSRGASHVTFVDRSRRMCALINANLNLCRIQPDESNVVMSDAGLFLQKNLKRGDEAWDLVYFDPPYAHDYSVVLNLLGAHSKLIAENSLLVVEHDRRKSLLENFGNLRRRRILEQGGSALSFYEIGEQ
jgi:16S rRNA (guanine966-N2)-methyltransferase